MNTLLFILPFLLFISAGCANHFITSDDFDSKEDYYSFLNTIYKGDEIELYLLNDSIQKGFLAEIIMDSIHLQQVNEIDSAVGYINIYAMKDIHQIKYYRSQRLEGFFIGAAVGMAAGAVLRPFRSSSNSGEHAPNGSNIFGIGGIGAVLGLTAGDASERKEVIFLINRKQE